MFQDGKYAVSFWTSTVRGRLDLLSPLVSSAPMVGHGGREVRPIPSRDILRRREYPDQTIMRSFDSLRPRSRPHAQASGTRWQEALWPTRWRVRL
jgi:hypothetical protein